MLWIILIAIFAGSFAYFATQNTTLITINLGNYYLPDLPVYAVVLASIIATLLVSGLLYIIQSLSSSLTIHEKEDDLKKANNEIAELNRQIHKLELENTKLKSDIGLPEDENSI